MSKNTIEFCIVNSPHTPTQIRLGVTSGDVLSQVVDNRSNCCCVNWSTTNWPHLVNLVQKIQVPILPPASHTIVVVRVGHVSHFTTNDLNDLCVHVHLLSIS